MAVIDFFFWTVGGLLISGIAYLYFLGVQSLLPVKKHSLSLKPATRFAILIPAHNEAEIIKNPLESIRNMDYPQGLCKTFVIADNCIDETAQVAREYGVRSFERKDNERKGKGFALQWAFEYLQQGNEFDDYDAFVIIDADTIAEAGFLRAMDSRIAKGEMAIQGYYDVINPEGSPMASLSYLGFALSRNLKYKGRTRMGWSSNLLGNGMCFSKEVVSRFGWDATSIVEDLEYAVMLHLNGIKVSFAPEARVFAEIPKTFKNSRIQRSRWDIGRFQLRNRYLVPLLKKAIRNRDVSYLDTAMELLIPPFALFLILSFALFGLFMATSFRGFNILSTIWFTIVSGLGAYVLVGLVIAKANWKTYTNLMYAPFFMIWRVKTVIWGYFFRIGKQWIKTERKEIL
ncbi:MAG: glycosyltransferase family 2 protein [Desulfobacterales bacterium]|nr:glycosyltransferase family 2 protein [Desulfobacterales bacterium]